jgi:hypothetical protein
MNCLNNTNVYDTGIHLLSIHIEILVLRPFCALGRFELGSFCALGRFVRGSFRFEPLELGRFFAWTVS